MQMLQRLLSRLRNNDRLARILHGGASGLLAKGSSVLVNLISVPLLVHYLGTFEYGVWITISTTVVMLSVLDLGIANTLTNFIAEAYADQSPEAAQEYFATAFWITIGIAGTLACVGVWLWPKLDFGLLLHLSDPAEVVLVRWTLAVSAAYFLCSLPLNLANKVHAGYQEVHIANYFGILNSISGLIAIVLAVRSRASLVYLMAAYCSSMLLGSLALNFRLCIVSKPWLLPLPGRIRWGLSRQLFGEGILFFVLQLTSIVVYNSDNLVIAHYLGADRVTPYSVGWKLMSTASLIHGIMVPSLWAAFSAAYHKGEVEWVKQTYRSMRRRIFVVVAALAVLLALVGPKLIRLWAGPSAVPSSRLLWLMAAYVVLNCITTNQALLLTATRRLRLEASAAVLAAAVNILLTIRLVQNFGSDGVMMGTLVSFATCMVLPQAWEVGRVLNGRYAHSRIAAGQPLSHGS